MASLQRHGVPQNASVAAAPASASLLQSRNIPRDPMHDTHVSSKPRAPPATRDRVVSAPQSTLQHDDEPELPSVSAHTPHAPAAADGTSMVGGASRMRVTPDKAGHAASAAADGVDALLLRIAALEGELQSSREGRPVVVAVTSDDLLALELDMERKYAAELEVKLQALEVRAAAGGGTGTPSLLQQRAGAAAMQTQLEAARADTARLQAEVEALRRHAGHAAVCAECAALRAQVQEQRGAADEARTSAAAAELRVKDLQVRLMAAERRVEEDALRVVETRQLWKDVVDGLKTENETLAGALADAEARASEAEARAAASMSAHPTATATSPSRANVNEITTRAPPIRSGTASPDPVAVANHYNAKFPLAASTNASPSHAWAASGAQYRHPAAVTAPAPAPAATQARPVEAVSTAPTAPPMAAAAPPVRIEDIARQQADRLRASVGSVPSTLRSSEASVPSARSALDLLSGDAASSSASTAVKAPPRRAPPPPTAAPAASTNYTAMRRPSTDATLPRVPSQGPARTFSLADAMAGAAPPFLHQQTTATNGAPTPAWSAGAPAPAAYTPHLQAAPPPRQEAPAETSSATAKVLSEVAHLKSQMAADDAALAARIQSLRTTLTKK